MKRNTISAMIVGMLLLAGLQMLRSGDAPAAGSFEYLSIRWDGRDNTHVIRPGGHCESVGDQLRQMDRPRFVDERAFYLNVVMNGLVKEGYEFAGMTDDIIVMRRLLR